MENTFGLILFLGAIGAACFVIFKNKAELPDPKEMRETKSNQSRESDDDLGSSLNDSLNQLSNNETKYYDASGIKTLGTYTYQSAVKLSTNISSIIEYNVTVAASRDNNGNRFYMDTLLENKFYQQVQVIQKCKKLQVLYKKAHGLI